MSAEIVNLADFRPSPGEPPAPPRGVIRRNSRVAFRGEDWRKMSDLAFSARKAIGQLEAFMSELVERSAQRKR